MLPRDLSGGEQQVAIARALVNKPALEDGRLRPKVSTRTMFVAVAMAFGTTAAWAARPRPERAATPCADPSTWCKTTMRSARACA